MYIKELNYTRIPHGRKGCRNRYLPFKNKFLIKKKYTKYYMFVMKYMCLQKHYSDFDPCYCRNVACVT